MQNFRHYLQPLVMPSSVALIGASERPGSLGRVVYENLLAGGFTGEIVAVNPNRKRIFGHRVARSLATLKKRIDCAVIATPCDQVSDVLAQGGSAGLRSAVILTAPPVARRRRSGGRARSRPWPPSTAFVLSAPRRSA